jgi:hypothetical protein
MRASKHRILMTLVLATTTHASACTMPAGGDAEQTFFRSIEPTVPRWRPLDSPSHFLSVSVERLSKRSTELEPTQAEIIERVGARDLADTTPAPAPEADPDAPTCVQTGTAVVTVEVTGSFSALHEGRVEVWGDGEVLAEARVGEDVEIPTGCEVDLLVTMDGLVDAPVFGLVGLVLPLDGVTVVIPLALDTAILAVDAYRGGRRVSGVVRLFRAPEGAAEPEEVECGSIGANGSGRELSAGRYELRMYTGSGILRSAVTLFPGDTRRVRLER